MCDLESCEGDPTFTDYIIKFRLTKKKSSVFRRIRRQSRKEIVPKGTAGMRMQVKKKVFFTKIFYDLDFYLNLENIFFQIPFII